MRKKIGTQSINKGQETRSQEIKNELEAELDSLYDMEQLAGFALSIFSSDSILYENAYGFQDIQLQKRYNGHTIQIIASITKSFVGVALMQAVEDGVLSLDDEINSYIDFELVNPYHPNISITLRHLASHTSSISDSDKSDKGYRFEQPLNPDDFPEAYTELIPNYNITTDLSMAQFLEMKLSVEGDWHEDSSFRSVPPGTEYEYSNYGVTLLALVIERVRKRTFDSIVVMDILEPLGMDNSTWNAQKSSEPLKAVLYNELLNEIPDYKLITYPDGGLCSSVSDLTLFLQEIMKCYHGEGTLISEASCRAMLTKQYQCERCEDGICWDLSFDGLAGHGGNDFGTATLMYFDPDKDIGRILFTNTSVETEAQENEFYGVFNTLFKYDLRNK